MPSKAEASYALQSNANTVWWIKISYIDISVDLLNLL